MNPKSDSLKQNRSHLGDFIFCQRESPCFKGIERGSRDLSYGLNPIWKDQCNREFEIQYFTSPIPELIPFHPKYLTDIQRSFRLRGLQESLTAWDSIRGYRRFDFPRAIRDPRFPTFDPQDKKMSFHSLGKRESFFTVIFWCYSVLPTEHKMKPIASLK